MVEHEERESSAKNEPGKKPDADATSKETLSDVEDSQKVPSGGGPTDGPSPDGAFDEREEKKDAGPL